MITLIQDGVEYTYAGLRHVKRGEHFINNNGGIRKYMGIQDGNLSTIVVPVPLEHTFGGVTFVETGEYRKVEHGEWFLSREGSAVLGPYPVYRERNRPTMISYKILLPVRLA